MRILNPVSNAFYDAGIFAWDILLSLGNLIRSSHPVGQVTHAGHPGYGGHWPEYRPPQEGDSRCSCPALNAMANHGTSWVIVALFCPPLNASFWPLKCV